MLFEVNHMHDYFNVYYVFMHDTSWLLYLDMFISMWLVIEFLLNYVNSNQLTGFSKMSSMSMFLDSS